MHPYDDSSQCKLVWSAVPDIACGDAASFDTTGLSVLILSRSEDANSEEKVGNDFFVWCSCSVLVFFYFC